MASIFCMPGLICLGYNPNIFFPFGRIHGFSFGSLKLQLSLRIRLTSSVSAFLTLLLPFITSITWIQPNLTLLLNIIQSLGLQKNAWTTKYTSSLMFTGHAFSDTFLHGCFVSHLIKQLQLEAQTSGQNFLPSVKG